MPMSEEFENRLYPILPKIADHFGTPFHIYDEVGIRKTGTALTESFSSIAGFREFFAVKALPNPRILELMREMKFGFDCSSIAELELARRVGGRGEDIMFTSNNTSLREFQAAADQGGSIHNLDDINLVAKVPQMPELISFRYNPGPRRSGGNVIIGNPVEAKYGVAHEQMVDAYRAAIERGARRFGLHTMLVSNERNAEFMVETARMLLEVAEWIGGELDIRFEFLNLGGGLGIPYRPQESALDLQVMAEAIYAAFRGFEKRNGYMPALHLESGRFMTGSHGALVVRAINRKDTYRTYIGVDASMSALMRPGMYGAYHHITVPGREAAAERPVVDVVGALCENNDKFAIQRPLPPIEIGDLLCIHDTGAHGHAMGFNYNGRLRPKEILLRGDGHAELIRREETLQDHFATLSYEPRVL